jgi:hypothetical protein
MSMKNSDEHGHHHLVTSAALFGILIGSLMSTTLFERRISWHQ